MTGSLRTGWRRRTALHCGLGLALCLCGRPAHAAPSQAIPEECGSLSEFEAELQRRLGNVPLDARVTLTPEVSGYDLVVEVGNERRELHDASCRELLRAAVVIALALLEPKTLEASAPPEPTAAGAAQPKSTPRSGPRFALTAGGGVHFGTVPEPTLLLDIDAQLKWLRWGVATGFRYLLPVSVQDRRNIGARVGGIGAYAAGIFEPWPRLQGRLGFVAYRLSGTGLGSLQTGHDTAWEAGPTCGVSFIPYEYLPFSTSVGAEGQLNLLGAHFEILHYGPVFQVPTVSGSAFARAGVVW